MLLEVKHLKKIFKTRFSKEETTALVDIDFGVEEGEYIAIMGESGSGKTTLLNILSTLEKPTSGQVLLNKEDITAIKDKEISAFRRDHLGFVFQDFNLLDTLNVRDNIYLPLVLSKSSVELMKSRLKILVPKLNIENLLEKQPFELSGGQMRRVAIAGILAMEPEVLVLDEPTAGLDPKARIEMMQLFESIHQTGQTVVLVTHLMDDVADYAHYVYLLEKGHIISCGTPSDVFQEVDFLKAHELGVPKATHFADQLQKTGAYTFEKLPITRAELVNLLTSLSVKSGGEN
ncbi:MAG TPA: ABC transporter ATP-binding protein [Lactococcus lactis]|nr:ABC transporter ATP-binding protein [Lactococcus lactis]